MSIFPNWNGQVDNMLMQERFDLNTMQLKEGLRKTMLDQEIIFKKQVQELHRLYRTQKILMEDIGLNLKQFDECTLKKACIQSTWLFYSSNPSQVLPDRHNSVYNSIHLKPLGLQLCSDDHCASRVDQEALNLSLSVIDEDRRTKATTSTNLDLNDNCCTQNIIDLEVSVEGISNEKENCAACTTTVATMTKCESQISVLSGKMENSSCPFGNAEYSPGFRDCHEALTVDKSSLEDCISHEAGKLELNQVQLDDLSCYSSDNLVTCHSTASSLHIFGISSDRTQTTHPCATWRKESSRSLDLDDASDILQWDDAVNSVVMSANTINEITDPKCKGIKGCEAGLTGNNFVSRNQVGPCKDLRYCTSDPENKYTRSVWELSGGQITNPDGTYVATKLANRENTKDDVISCASAEEKYEDGSILPALCESSCIVDSSTSSIKARQPQINSGDSNPITPDQHLGTGDGNELGHDCPKKVELPEVSVCILTAAQLLVNFSLGSSSSCQDCSSRIESIEVDKKIEKLECSDSYEQIALKLEECNADDCSVSSKPYEIDITGKKDFGFRLKRGRRYKDFQKEILPGLASLSRHEIQEDVNILEAILRSREYRKIRAKMGDQRSWFAPVRSRRSKRRNVRRKMF